MDFGTIITAMVTPFDHNDNIDYRRTEDLINHLLNNGTEALVVAGTTGESPALSREEILSLIQFTKKVVNNRVPVIAGTGSNNTRSSIELTKQVEEIGVDGVMLVTPYYNKPSQRGMYEHFKAIAAATTLPVMLYNIPGRSGVNLTPETIIQLSEIPNITSVKEASGDLDAVTTIIGNTDSSFHVYSGDDSLTIPLMAVGGTGVVSVSSHIIGNDMQHMVSLFKKGQVKQAAVMHQQLLPVMKALFAAPNPSPVKAALNMLGLEVGSVRLPMLPLNEEEVQTLKNVLYYIENHKVS